MTHSSAHKGMLVNGRFLAPKMTGVQRHGFEVCRELIASSPVPIEILVPPGNFAIPAELQGRTTRIGRARGQLWEQTTLAMYARRRGQTLYSPANLGPLAREDQLLTIHDLFAVTHPEWFSARMHHWYRFAWPRLARRVRAILTVSRYSKQQICTHFGVPESCVHVVYNGVSTQMQRQGDDVVTRVRARYGLPETFLLAVGSLEPRKNLAGLIKAWRMLPKERRLPLVITGHQGVSHVFRTAGLDDLDCAEDICFTGYVAQADLPGLYSAASALIHVAFAEGFGLPPLEAACCETPVVVASNSAQQEIMGSYAIGADAHDLPSIADALLRAIDSPHDAETRRLWAQELRDRYSWAAVARRVLEVYHMTD